MHDPLALAQELAGETRFVIGVLDDPAFAPFATPRDLTPAHFVAAWSDRPDVCVVLLDAADIRAYSILFAGRMDALVYPYGPHYPMDAPPFYSGQTLDAFLKRGGAVLTTGGVPFGAPTNAEQLGAINGGDAAAQPEDDPECYDKWVAPLGVKYYEHPYAPPITRVATEWLPSLADPLPVDGCALGIVVTTSAHAPEPRPPHGNVFPERVPARQVIPLVWGTDDYGQTLAVSALLVQDFTTGSRRIHFAHTQAAHPLAPAAPHFAALLADLLQLLMNRVVARDVATDLACYRGGEAVQVAGELVSFAATPISVTATLAITQDRQTVATQEFSVTLSPREVNPITWTWTPEEFVGDEYTVTLTAHHDGRLVAAADNGFVVWRDDVARAGPTVTTEGTYLRCGTDAFVLGTNYYESTRGEIMWYRPRMDRIAADVRQMAAQGITYLRPHYHHHKWFADYLRFQHGDVAALFPFYADVADATDPLPDERSWRILDAIIYLCQKYGIVFGGDLFTLVPAEMGDPRGWFHPREVVTSAAKRVVQKAFLRALTERYHDVPGISWDLWNEPIIPLELLQEWTADLRAALRATEGGGKQRPITVGGGVGERLGALVDYVGAHGNHAALDASGRPVLLQEMYFDHREDLASERSMAEQVRMALVAAVANGVSGAAPWSWTRQMRLWQDVYLHHYTFPMEKWDDRLGMHVHDDGTPQVTGQVFRDLGAWLRIIPLRGYDAATHQVTTPWGTVTTELTTTAPGECAIYHAAGARLLGAMARSHIVWEGHTYVTGPAHAYIYIMVDGRQGDILTAPTVYLKSEAPGQVCFTKRSEPRAAHLVERRGTTDHALTALACDDHASGVTITLAPTQTAYWIRLTW